MSSKEPVRQAIRERWREFLREALPSALGDLHVEACAQAVVGRVWPACEPEDVAAIHGADDSFLRRVGGIHDPDTLRTRLEADLLPVVQRTLEPLFPGNHYVTKRGDLRGLLREQIAHAWDDIRRAADDLFECRDTDCLADASRIRHRVLVLLQNLCLGECHALAPADDDASAKRHLKILAALSTFPGTQQDGEIVLRGLRTGRVSEFPYVLKYLRWDAAPAAKRFRGPADITLEGFTQDLEALLPESHLLRTALVRYREGNGTLQRLIRSDSALDRRSQADFDRLPDYVPRERGGLLLPKWDAVVRNRRDRFTMPDGTTCAVGLGVLLEWILRQAVVALKVGSGKGRGDRLLGQLAEKHYLNGETFSLLDTVFDHRSLNVRDGLAHGLFFADERRLLDQALAGLCRALAGVVRDLSDRAGFAAVAAPGRWDAGRALLPRHVNTVGEQYGVGYNLLDQMRDDANRAHVFSVLDAAVPDKALLGKAAFLLWIDRQRADHAGEPVDPHDLLVGIFAGLTTLEELFRATLEAHGRRTLVIRPDGADGAMCELAILHFDAGMLLHGDNLDTLFEDDATQARFQASIEAVKYFRDELYHGNWNVLAAVGVPLLHLVVKLLFALCGTVRAGGGQGGRQGETGRAMRG